ncbi:tail fiber protein [Synechococcus phage S-N03]|uniref:Tail fiber protein n=1 Tax=Synechococcus phage S-N03 TaxID=2718943 RepID=A0A6G8R5H0_9CAUD|nr:tail fiber protein [Synechococcus phage S-N03]QIN96640.1 tail fiber protein [Synechococcus phage S-N03]
MSTLKTKNIQHPSASGPAIALNPNGTFTADIEDLSAESLHGGTFSLRNKLINGSFDIWQRGTTFSGEVYTADRWFVGGGGGASNRVFGPAGVATYALQVALNTADVQQFIELPATGRAGEYQVGTSWTLSWYQNHSTAGGASLTFMDSSSVSGGSNPMTFGTPVAVETVGSWTRYKAEIAITEAPVSTNTCLRVVVGNTGVTNTQYTGIQFEKGGLTTFEQRPAGLELALCQRYYQTVPKEIRIAVTITGSGQVNTYYQFPVTFRVAPTASDVTYTSATATGGAFNVRTNSMGDFSVTGPTDTALTTQLTNDLTLDAEF